MPIQVGDKIPSAKFRVMTGDGPAWQTTEELFGGKKVVLFGLPGAFTGTCHKSHLPGFLQHGDAIKKKGVDMIAVTAVNDHFVMEAWKDASGAAGAIEFLADGNAEFAKAIDMTFDGAGNGLGTRSKRYCMVIDNGVVKSLSVEESPGKVDLTSAENLLKTL